MSVLELMILLHTRRLVLPYIFHVRVSIIVYICFFPSVFLVDKIETEFDVGEEVTLGLILFGGVVNLLC